MPGVAAKSYSAPSATTRALGHEYSILIRLNYHSIFHAVNLGAPPWKVNRHASPVLLRPRMPEHHVELREAEIEGVALVNQRPFDGVAKRLREHGAEFEPAEAGAENEDACFHRLVN